MPEYPQFSDFAEETKRFEGDKKKIEDILNKSIFIVDFKIKESKQRKDTLYATIQFKLDSKIYIAFTGSDVIMSQLTKYKDNIPFHATIIKIDKYYTFS